MPRRRRENFCHSQGVYKGFTLIFERRRRENLEFQKIRTSKKVTPMFPKKQEPTKFRGFDPKNKNC